MNAGIGNGPEADNPVPRRAKVAPHAAVSRKASASAVASEHKVQASPFLTMDAGEAAPRRVSIKSIKESLKREWATKELRSLNLRFARNLALFIGAIYAFRKYGKWMEI